MILITGGLGFIGSHTAAALLEMGESVLLLQHRTSSVPDFLRSELDKRVFIASGDLGNTAALQAIIGKYGVDGVIHLAAPPLAVESVELEFQMNLNGLTAILEAARATRLKRLIIASSIGVYRALPHGPFTEAAPLPVGASFGVEAFKKTFETLADYYTRRTGLDVVCLRISSIYGPLYRSLANLPSRVVHGAVRHQVGPLPHGSSQTYANTAGDFLYVKDCAQGISRLQLASSLNHRIYNLGAGYATSVATLCSAVRRVIPDAQFSLQPGDGPDQRSDAFEDISRIASEIGFKPRAVDDAIADYVSWLRAGNAF